MPRTRLIVFCLTFIGAYGVLYAIHAGRTAANSVYDLESKFDFYESKIYDLENGIEDVKFELSNSD